MARTPCFPSEVWLAIFDWATFVPFALDTHAPDPFGYPGSPSHRHIRKGIWESMCTKRHLVLVCREWRALATRFLYQTVVLTRLETSAKFLFAGRSPSIGKGVSDCVAPARPNGHWVERIDILLPLEGPFPKDIFTRLLGSTPNLQILVVAPVRANPYWRNCFDDFLALFGALAAKLAPSLRVLHILSRGLIKLHDPRVLPIPEAINGRPLRVLAFGMEYWGAFVGERMLDLPNIEHLDIPSRWTEALLTACNVPSSLVSLSLLDKYAPTKRLADGQLSIARNGINTLRVDDHVSGHDLSVGPSESLLHHIAVAFPSLRCLIVRVHFASFAEYLPPVKKLGLCVIFDEAGEDEQVQLWETLCATIERLIAVTPTVEVVRLFQRLSRDDFDLGYDDYNGVVNVVQQTSATLLKHNVRFEDIDGQLLHALVPEGSGEGSL